MSGRRSVRRNPWLRVAAVLAIVLAIPASASAEANSFSDPQGDAGGSPIDIVEVAHDNDETSVAYAIQAADPFTTSDIDQITWLLNFDGDEGAEGCIVVDEGPNGLRGTISECTGKGSSTSVEHEQDILSTFVTRSQLEGVGLGQNQTTYTYSVVAQGSGSYYYFSDEAPNGNSEYTHDLTTESEPGPTTTSTGTASDSTVVPGQQIEISGAGFAPDEQLSVTFFSHPVALTPTRSDQEGSYRTAATIPTDAELGEHVIEVRGPGANGGTHVSRIPLTVVSAAGRGSEASGAGLPRSGGGLGAVYWAFGTLTLGELALGLELFVRRRETPVFWEHR